MNLVAAFDDEWVLCVQFARLVPYDGANLQTQYHGEQMVVDTSAVELHNHNMDHILLLFNPN